MMELLDAFYGLGVEAKIGFGAFLIALFLLGLTQGVSLAIHRRRQRAMVLEDIQTELRRLTGRAEVGGEGARRQPIVFSDRPVRSDRGVKKRRADAQASHFAVLGARGRAS